MATVGTRTLADALIISGQCSDDAAADKEIREMAERMMDGEDPEEILYEYGLEPDYVFDIIEACV